jgi:lipopolysaccharide transport system permease protein
MQTPFDQPAVLVIIEPTRGRGFVDLRAAWRHRRLLYVFIWRDLKVRYKQTFLGAVWIVLQPLLSTLLLTIVFGVLARIPSGRLPYAVFALCGLLPWYYFASALSRAATSLVSNASLVTKVYFPRVLVPLASVLGALVDFVVSLPTLAVLMIVYDISLKGTAPLMLSFVLLAAVTALAVGLWIAALAVRFRDASQLLPFLLQAGMYSTPIVYPITLVPDRWRALLGLNPMVSVVEGFRWALTGEGQLSLTMLLLSLTVTTALLLGGLIVFRTAERTIADVI